MSKSAKFHGAKMGMPLLINSSGNVGGRGVCQLGATHGAAKIQPFGQSSEPDTSHQPKLVDQIYEAETGNVISERRSAGFVETGGEESTKIAQPYIVIENEKPYGWKQLKDQSIRPAFCGSTTESSAILKISQISDDYSRNKEASGTVSTPDLQTSSGVAPLPEDLLTQPIFMKETSEAITSPDVLELSNLDRNFAASSGIGSKKLKKRMSDGPLPHQSDVKVQKLDSSLKQLSKSASAFFGNLLVRFNIENGSGMDVIKQPHSSAGTPNSDDSSATPTPVAALLDGVEEGPKTPESLRMQIMNSVYFVPISGQEELRGFMEKSGRDGPIDIGLDISASQSKKLIDFMDDSTMNYPTVISPDQLTRELVVQNIWNPQSSPKKLWNINTSAVVPDSTLNFGASVLPKPVKSSQNYPDALDTTMKPGTEASTESLGSEDYCKPKVGCHHQDSNIFNISELVDDDGLEPVVVKSLAWGEAADYQLNYLECSEAAYSAYKTGPRFQTEAHRQNLEEVYRNLDKNSAPEPPMDSPSWTMTPANVNNPPQFQFEDSISCGLSFQADYPINKLECSDAAFVAYKQGPFFQTHGYMNMLEMAQERAYGSAASPKPQSPTIVSVSEMMMYSSTGNLALMMKCLRKTRIPAGTGASSETSKKSFQSSKISNSFSNFAKCCHLLVPGFSPPVSLHNPRFYPSLSLFRYGIFRVFHS